MHYSQLGRECPISHTEITNPVALVSADGQIYSFNRSEFFEWVKRNIETRRTKLMKDEGYTEAEANRFEIYFRFPELDEDCPRSAIIGLKKHLKLLKKALQDGNGKEQAIFKFIDALALEKKRLPAFSTFFSEEQKSTDPGLLDNFCKRILNSDLEEVSAANQSIALKHFYPHFMNAIFADKTLVELYKSALSSDNLDDKVDYALALHAFLTEHYHIEQQDLPDITRFFNEADLMDPETKRRIEDSIFKNPKASVEYKLLILCKTALEAEDPEIKADAIISVREFAKNANLNLPSIKSFFGEGETQNLAYIEVCNFILTNTNSDFQARLEAISAIAAVKQLPAALAWVVGVAAVNHLIFPGVLYYAAANLRNESLVDVLLSLKIRPLGGASEELLDAVIANGDASILRKILPLYKEFFAARTKKEEPSVFLIKATDKWGDRGVPLIQALIEAGESPLLAVPLFTNAVANGQTEIFNTLYPYWLAAKRLSERYLDPNSPGSHRVTPLIMAINQKRINREIVEALLRGASEDEQVAALVHLMEPNFVLPHRAETIKIFRDNGIAPDPKTLLRLLRDYPLLISIREYLGDQSIKDVLGEYLIRHPGEDMLLYHYGEDNVGAISHLRHLGAPLTTVMQERLLAKLADPRTTPQVASRLVNTFFNGDNAGQMKEFQDLVARGMERSEAEILTLLNNLASYSEVFDGVMYPDPSINIGGANDAKLEPIAFVEGVNRLCFENNPVLANVTNNVCQVFPGSGIGVIANAGDLCDTALALTTSSSAVTDPAIQTVQNLMVLKLLLGAMGRYRAPRWSAPASLSSRVAATNSSSDITITPGSCTFLRSVDTEVTAQQQRRAQLRGKIEAAKSFYRRDYSRGRDKNQFSRHR